MIGPAGQLKSRFPVILCKSHRVCHGERPFRVRQSLWSFKIHWVTVTVTWTVTVTPGHGPSPGPKTPNPSHGPGRPLRMPGPAGHRVELCGAGGGLSRPSQARHLACRDSKDQWSWAPGRLTEMPVCSPLAASHSVRTVWRARSQRGPDRCRGRPRGPGLVAVRVRRRAACLIKFILGRKVERNSNNSRACSWVADLFKSSESRRRSVPTWLEVQVTFC